MQKVDVGPGYAIGRGRCSVPGGGNPDYADCVWGCCGERGGGEEEGSEEVLEEEGSQDVDAELEVIVLGCCFVWIFWYHYPCVVDNDVESVCLSEELLGGVFDGTEI